MSFINWGNETPEQKEARRKFEEEQMLYEQAVRMSRTVGVQMAGAASAGGSALAKPVLLQFISVGDVYWNRITELTAVITDDGGNNIIEVGIAWAEHPNPTKDDTYTNFYNAGPLITITMEDLTASTTYHIRAFARTDKGEIFYSPDDTTTTLAHVAGLDFTIEWFMKINTWTTHPRPYSLGSFGNSPINAVSIENGGIHMYWWQNSQYRIDSTFASSTAWHHYAICRDNGTVRMFRDGVSIGTPFTLNSTMDATGKLLYIGSDLSDPNAYVNGLITNFRWTNKALYTANFTPSTTPLTALPDTKLLLRATDDTNKLLDSSALAKTVTDHNSVTWSSDDPFGGAGGSLSFNGTNQYLSLAASTDWNL